VNKDKLDILNTLGPWLGKTSKMMEALMYYQFKKDNLDISVKQWLLLKFLYIKDGQSQNQLAFLTNRDKGSLTRLVNTVEKKDLIERIPSKEDKRVNLIFLTAKGTKVYEASKKSLQIITETLHTGISDDEISLAIGILKKVIGNIQESLDFEMKNRKI